MSTFDTAPVSLRSQSSSTETSAPKPTKVGSDDNSKPFDQQLETEINRHTDSSVESETADQQMTVPLSDEIEKITSPTEVAESSLVLASLLTDNSEEENPDLAAGNPLPIQAGVNVVPTETAKSSQQLAGEKMQAMPGLTLAKSNQSLLKPIQQNQKSGAVAMISETQSSETTDLAELLAQPDRKNTEAAKQPADTLVAKNEWLDVSRATRNQGFQQVASAPVVNDTTVKDISSPLNQTIQLQTPVTQKSWGQAFAQQISMMISNGQQQVAEMQLNPARMGSIAVRVSVEEETANISFVTTQTAVKEAIEVSLPRLKEQLEQQGLDLGHVDVSSRDAEQPSDDDANSQLFSREDEVDTEASALEEINFTYEENSGVSVFV